MPNRAHKDLSEIEANLPIPSTELIVNTEWIELIFEEMSKKSRARIIQGALRRADELKKLGSVSRLHSSNADAEGELRKNRLHAGAVILVQAHMLAERLIDDTATG